MSIEKDISSRFRNDYQKAGVNLIFTYNWMNEKMKAIFDRHDITPQQFNILRILRGAGKPISTLQIRQRMLDKMSDTSRIVDRLILKGLATKAVCPKDKRLVDVSISTQGLELLQKMDVYETDIDAIFGNLSEAETKTFNSLLDKIRGSND